MGKIFCADGSCIYLTEMHCRRPNGESFEGCGIKPDYLVPLTDEQTDAAYHHLKCQLENKTLETPDPVLAKALELAK